MVILSVILPKFRNFFDEKLFYIRRSRWIDVFIQVMRIIALLRSREERIVQSILQVRAESQIFGKLLLREAFKGVVLSSKVVKHPFHIFLRVFRVNR